MNVADVAPAGTVTLPGTVAVEVLLLDNETVTPPDGAGPVSVTVPCEAVPLVSEAGFNETADRAGGRTVTPPLLAMPAYDAVMVEVLDEATAEVTMEKVAPEDPCGTSTFCGTDATVPLLLARVIRIPCDGAAPLSPIVP